jgi:excisionase family DNA binding protein
MATKLLKAGDVAEILNISRSKAFGMMSRGEIPVVRFGGSVRVEAEDLEQFIKQQKNGMQSNKIFPA